MRVIELERVSAPHYARTCLETILEAFPGATVVSPEELDLIR